MTNTSHSQSTETPSTLEEKVVFFFVGVGVIALTYGFFKLVDFLPEPKEEGTAVAQVEDTKKADNAPSIAESTEQTGSPLPTLIIFDSLKKQVPVLNPTEDTVEALDTALLSGVVRHPDSADLHEEGTMFILGHSSYLPNVKNANFQAFNGIQKLEWGDTIRVQSKDMEYVYSVDRVYEAKASSAEVSLQHSVAKLTLATCNSFGTKDDRFIVEATLISKHSLGGK
jgi:LPXTG-site transpeptidase (sortase) family protein